jgi:hypothetical protein
MTDISDLSEMKPRITVFGVGGAERLLSSRYRPRRPGYCTSRGFGE